ncbi:MAG: arsenate reductase (glutaredoxin) [Thermoanaerobaculia bacterium]|nr:arsenate reductase (glutaredoxin) [Thermoanaerobaculia bacterium]
MLDERGAHYRYREYTREPLSQEELRRVLALLGKTPRDVLRTRDAKKFGLTGDESDDQLIAAMASTPNLLQRPIGVLGNRAVIGRPVENLLSLLEDE